MSEFDEHCEFLCACKGEPYTAVEWARQVLRLRAELADAERRADIAFRDGWCVPARFAVDGEL